MTGHHRIATAVSMSLIGLLGCGGAGARLPPSIPAIQGAGHRSPLVGTHVQDVVGIVTGLRERSGRQGFFLQDPVGDDDPATSDAVFVLTGELPAAVARGDRVAVTGRVEEVAFDPSQLPETRIATHPVSGVHVLERGLELPAPVRLGRGGREIPSGTIDDDALKRFDPGDDAIDFWESLEGMRVEIPDAVVVAPTTPYRRVAVLADRGAESGPRTWRGGIARRGEDQNPEIVLIDLPRGRAVDASVGDRFTAPLVGIVEYDYAAYQVTLEAPVPELARSKIERPRTRLRADGSHLTIATYNVENLSLVDAPERFARAAEVLVDVLGSPDVVALQEIQDDTGPEDDGVVSAEGTMRALAEAVRRAGGPAYRWVQLDPRNDEDGGQPGANIRVALLYHPDRVDVVRRGDPRSAGATIDRDGNLQPSPGRLAAGNPCFRSTRKPLAVELSFSGCPLVLVVNHWSSKRGDDAAFGATQPPVRHSEPTRTCQAETVAAFVGEILDHDGKAGVVVLGDLNEHEDRPPLDTLRSAGLRDLLDDVAPERRYSFNYRGNSQLLDHVVVSPALAARDPEVEVLHVNADLPAAERASDHDPVLARLAWGGEICETGSAP